MKSFRVVDRRRTAELQGFQPADWNREDIPTWEKFDHELSTEVKDPKLRAEIDALEARGYHHGTGQRSVEALHQLRQENTEAGRKFRLDEQDELLDERARIGNKIQDIEFLRRFNLILRREELDRVARFHVGTAIVGGRWRYTVGLGCIVPTIHGGEMKSICQIQPGIMSEYSVLRVDIHDMPLNEKYRGWRTVLLRAIAAGTITERQAHEEFGESSGIAGRRYRQQLWAMRNF